MEGSGPPDGPLSKAGRARQANDGGLHGYRPRTSRLHVGRRQGGTPHLIVRRGSVHLAHGRRRDHGRGMPVRRFVAGKLTDARSKIGTAPDA